MKPRLYLETTIPSYLVGRPSRDLLVAAHQQITREWWESRRSAFGLYVSELVVQEVRAGDAALATQRLEMLRHIPVLAVDTEILKLAEALVTAGPIPQSGRRCGAHRICDRVRLRVLADVECRHLANAELQRGIRRVVEGHGYDVPGLCTPEELMGEEEP
jgi:hypothetical protein